MSENETYHIRIRGNVLGPFRRDKLLALIQRGQLTRVHEVSRDGGEWRPAGEFPELFPPQANSPASQPNATEAKLGTTASDGGTPSPSSISTSPESQIVWFYEQDGREHGPVLLPQLLELIRKGMLGPNNQVWKEGMPNWQPIRSTELAVHLPSRAPSPTACSSSIADNDQIAELPPTTVQLLLDIRTWSTIAAVGWCVIMGVSLLGSFFATVINQKAAGVLLLVTIGCGVFSVPTLSIFMGNSNLVALRYTPSFAVLDNALIRWRTYWIWMAIFTMLSVIFVVIIVIIGLSEAARLARW